MDGLTAAKAVDGESPDVKRPKGHYGGSEDQGQPGHWAGASWFVVIPDQEPDRRERNDDDADLKRRWQEIHKARNGEAARRLAGLLSEFEEEFFCHGMISFSVIELRRSQMARDSEPQEIQQRRDLVFGLRSDLLDAQHVLPDRQAAFGQGLLVDLSQPR